MREHADQLLRVLDLAGTFVFATEGGLAATDAHLDIFGVAVLATCTAIGGGIIRDVLIGATPPAALRDWRYLFTVLVATLLVALLRTLVEEVRPVVLITLDAGGLSLFAVAGTQKALDFGLGEPVACLMGVITGVGGGVIRDVLLNRVPLILHADIYATAALAGAATMIAARRLHAPPVVAAIAGAVVCFGLRLIAVRFAWHLPSVVS